MDIEALSKYIETVWTDERSSFDQKRNKTKYAIQQHLNQPNGSNMVLAVSGQLITKIEEDICDELSYLPNAGVTPNGVSLVAFDSVVEIVRKAFKAACASAKGGPAED